MKKTKKKIIGTDYFFEAIFKKARAFLLTNMPAKLATLKILTIFSWFKDIN
ncbi:hypothetical protein [Winogradskyella tangerina]|uniref:hypothetical protein n=1 Tax=Winogradskyella tangerina TaxID=2023240 RepID=UPI00130039D5|nr:hypothetical protein [Winogradskyella tangerina]